MENKQTPYSNMVEYAKRSRKTFAQEPLNEVDCLIFSWLVYLNLHEDYALAFSGEGAPLKDLLKAEFFEEMFDKTWSPEETLQLLFYCVASPRFREIRLRYYRNEVIREVNLQFAALVFSIGPEEHVLAYRGTDWSITGWKEDALLALDTPIPAQKMAVSYMNEIAEILPGRFTVTGHSKGGNLAVYAAVCCSENARKRIGAVYSFDGPGLQKKELNSPEFLSIQPRIRKFVPQASYFGMLFGAETELRIIRSSEKSIWQHNPISWEVSGNRLRCEQEHSPFSALLNRRINRWLNSLNDSERRILIRAVFDVIHDLNITGIDAFMNNITAYIPDVLTSVSKMDAERRKAVKHILWLIVTGDPAKTDSSSAVIPGLKARFEDYKSEQEFDDEFPLFLRKIQKTE